MFRSLRTDFGEFMSSVKEDSSMAAKSVLDDAVHVLSKIDDTVATGASAVVVVASRHRTNRSKTNDLANTTTTTTEQDACVRRAKKSLSKAEQEALHRMGLVHVYTLPLENPGAPTSDSTDLTLLVDDDEEDEDFDIATEEKDDSSAAMETTNANEEEDQRELQNFLQTFDIKDKTSDIAALLEQHDTLRETFSELVPCRVRYEDFWLRHFWRCDPARIERAWARRAAVQTPARRQLLRQLMVQLSPPVRAALGLISNNNKLDRDDDDDVHDESTAQAALEYTLLQELEGMQHAMAASNQRIYALRTSLDDTKDRLRLAQCQAASLQQLLDETQADLQAKALYVAELEDKLAGLGHAVSSDGEHLTEEGQSVKQSSSLSVTSLEADDEAGKEIVAETPEPSADDTPVEEEEEEKESTAEKVMQVPSPVFVVVEEVSTGKEEDSSVDDTTVKEEDSSEDDTTVKDEDSSVGEEGSEEEVSDCGEVESVETEESAPREQQESFQSPVKTSSKPMVDMLAAKLVSPTSILDTMKIERSSMFKFATNRLFGASSTRAKPAEEAEHDDDDERSVESGWGDESDIDDAEFDSMEENENLQTNRQMAEELGW